MYIVVYLYNWSMGMNFASAFPSTILYISEQLYELYSAVSLKAVHGRNSLNILSINTTSTKYVLLDGQKL